MNHPLILKKGTVIQKLDRYRYEVLSNADVIVEMAIPKKLLMNYLNIELGSVVYFTASSEDAKVGILTTKHDLMKYPELLLQKALLDENKD